MRLISKLSLFCAGLALSTGFGFAPANAAMTFVRTTPEQYQQTIHDIFGPSIKVDANAVETGFRDQGLLAIGARKTAMSSAGLEQFEALAQQIAVQVMDPKRNATLVHCTPKAADAMDVECASQFINRTGFLLFRRPLTAGETKAYVDTAAAATAKLKSFNNGLASALVEMLMAPEFLFRTERSAQDAKDPTKLHLDGYSSAARLSFFLWDSSPDAELLAAAQSGKLATQNGLNEQVDRLLNSPRVEYGLRAFFTDMLGFDGFATIAKDSAIFPKFTKNVEDDAREQTLRTIADQLLNKNKDYRDLFTTRETFLTPALAALYNVPLDRSQEMGGVTPWVPYQFPEGDYHQGILTHVSFLALHSHPGKTSPTLRGKALRENILCQKVPPPPGNVDFTLVQDTNNPKLKTVRDRLTVHRAEAMCAGCHKITDPIGLALENFNSAGETRTTENGVKIDVSGELNGKAFDGVTDLVKLISQDPATTSCLVNRAYSYGTARMPSADERTWLTGQIGDLSKTGVKWRDLMRRIAENPDFYTMPVPETQKADAK